MEQQRTVSASELTVEEQASLTSGKDAWHLQDVATHDIPGYMITDGPHGLRKAIAGEGASVPATCFPPAAGLSSSWNPELVRHVGEAMAEECLEEKVAVILGPGINMKRNPLGGRCFEYWSEDPVLAGHQAAALVEGVQSLGVGTSLKHFAANNQETDRFRVSAQISPRALREIYLPAFEYVVKHAHPWTLMCAYNKINGEYCSQNHWLLTDVLRDEWGFDGIVMSDWGACHDRVRALNAGLNLEMPPSQSDDEIVRAVEDGAISRDHLQRMAQGMLELTAKATPAMQGEHRYDPDAHQRIARLAARESIVVLKNENHVLPLSRDTRLGVIGEFARTPRYQGGGSSHITPTSVTSFLDALRSRSIAVSFAPGFSLNSAQADPSLERQALHVAETSQTVLMFMGLPESAESEGMDRTSMSLPPNQLALLQRVHAVNPNIVVVLSNGPAVSIAPWQDHARGIVEGWLLGQAGGEATADVLFGDCDASGRLSETLPIDITDDPSTLNFPGENQHVVYGEGVFIGYRYYDTFHKPVAYPFGYGLSYTDFTFSDPNVAVTGLNAATASVTVRNAGDRAGSCTVQFYVSPPASTQVSRPVHELKGFAKVDVEPGQSTRVTVELDSRAFAYWSEPLDGWHVEPGVYRIEIGTSSRDIAFSEPVDIPGDDRRPALTGMSTVQEWMSDPIGGPIVTEGLSKASDGQNEALPNDESARVLVLSMPLSVLTSFMGAPGKPVLASMLSRYAAAKATQGK